MQSSFIRAQRIALFAHSYRHAVLSVRFRGKKTLFLRGNSEKINMLLLIFVGQKLNITDHISVYEPRALFFFYFYPVSLDGGNLSLDAE